MPNFTEYYWMPYDVGVRKAKEFLFGGPRFYSGTEAEALGMVNRAVPAADLDRVVDEYVAKVVKQPGFTLRMYKQAVNQKDEQAGFQNFVKNAFSHWSLMAESLSSAGGVVKKKGGKNSIIPQKMAEKERPAQQKSKL